MNSISSSPDEISILRHISMPHSPSDNICMTCSCMMCHSCHCCRDLWRSINTAFDADAMSLSVFLYKYTHLRLYLTWIQTHTQQSYGLLPLDWESVQIYTTPCSLTATLADLRAKKINIKLRARVAETGWPLTQGCLVKINSWGQRSRSDVTKILCLW